MKFHRFEHVNQICRDLEATKQFYQTLFPQWYVRAEGSEDGWRWMHFGDRSFYFALNQPPQASTSTPTTGHIDHIGFAIEDSEAFKKLLEQHGIEYTVFLSPETKSRIYITDPDGTELELVEYNNDYELK